jgi:hypothetical protein
VRVKAKAAKAANQDKAKAKENLVAKVANAQLVMAQVWDQAPAQTKEAKAMAQSLEVMDLKEKALAKVEKAQKAEEMVLEKVMLEEKAEKDRLALRVKSVEIAMALAVKPLSMTLLTTLVKKECRKLKRRLISKPRKISESNKNNVANNVKNVLTKPKNPETKEMLREQ